MRLTEHFRLQEFTRSQTASRLGIDNNVTDPKVVDNLRRLCEKGLFENDGGTVRALLSREDYLARESRSFVEQSFGGSLPAFLAAFTRGKTLTREQQDTLQALIDEARRAL